MSWAAKLKSCCMGGDNNGSYLLRKCCSILVWSLRPTLCCGHSSHIILLCNRLVLLRVASVTCVLVYEFASGTTFSASTCTCKTSLDLKIPKYKDVNPKLQCQVFIDCKSESTSWFTLNVNLRNCKSFWHEPAKRKSWDHRAGNGCQINGISGQHMANFVEP